MRLHPIEVILKLDANNTLDFKTPDYDVGRKLWLRIFLEDTQVKFSFVLENIDPFFRFNTFHKFKDEIDKNPNFYFTKEAREKVYPEFEDYFTIRFNYWSIREVIFKYFKPTNPYNEEGEGEDVEVSFSFGKAEINWPTPDEL